MLTYSVLYFIFYFFNLVVIFIYCYSHIFVVVRRQARVMQGHQQQGSGSDTSSSQNQAQQKMEASVMKTVISLTAFFVVCWSPNNVYYLLYSVTSVPFNRPVYYVTVFTVFCDFDSCLKVTTAH